MRIDIHDVDHGACAVIGSPEGHRLMLDCGKSIDRPWSPSLALLGQRIDALLIQNLDEDHVEDLPALLQLTTIGALFSNTTVSSDALMRMKPDGMGNGVAKAQQILSLCGPEIGRLDQWLGGIHGRVFYNRYDVDFTDTNNLSLATFITYGPFTILFGGDLEKAGWKRLMLRPDFLTWLTRVNVLVASHHGRENGICDEMFDWCKPQLVIFSDGPKEHETQETVSWYAGKAHGIPDLTHPPGLFGLRPLRRVMTTRKDGTISIDVQPSGSWMAYRDPRPERQPSFSEVLAGLALDSRLFGGRVFG